MKTRIFKLSTATIAFCLLVFSTIFLGWIALQTGPKLTAANYNAERVIQFPAQRLGLVFDHKLATEYQIKSTPHTNFNAEIQHNQLVLSFKDPLKAATNYVFSGAAVSAATGAKSSFETEITTAALPLTVLVHSAGGDDPPQNKSSLYSYQVGKTVSARGQQNPRSYSGAKISEFASFQSWLAVLEEDQGATVFTVLNRADANFIPTRLEQPGAANLRQPQFSGDGALVGLKFFTGEADVLLFYPLSNLRAEAARTVVDEAGQAVHVRDWFFEPGSSTARVLSADGKVFRVPFGSAASRTAEVWDQTRLQSATSKVRSGKLTVEITADKRAVVAAGSVLYRPAASDTTITRLCVSPNQQFIAVQILGSDDKQQFVIVDPQTNRTVGAVNGDDASWCAGQ